MKNVKVKFIKDHVAGIKKGTERTLNPLHAQRLFEEGYVEKFTGAKEVKGDK